MKDTDDNIAPSPDKTQDNLEAINGIGPTFAKALYKIGIVQFADLTKYTPEQLATLLAERSNVKVAPERIETADWIGQAQALARATNHETGPQAEEQSEPYPTESPMVNEQQNWRQHAGFSLFFDYIEHETGRQEWQTRLYHEESGRELFLTGIDTSVWADWIIKRAKLLGVSDSSTAEEDEQDEVVEVPITAHAHDVKLQIIDVEPIQGSLTGSANDRYVVEVRFDISGPGAKSMVGRRIPYQVEIQTVNLAMSSLEHFVELGQLRLQPDKYKYVVRQEMLMPDAGRYELQTIVHIDPPAEMLAYHTGPTLNIV